ncbi:MAG: hypothetical protein ABSH42_08895 [Bryobacteraceae bacterium]|jgi:hypothetical protein
MDDRKKPLEDRIRSAVASSEFVKANALWVEMGDRLRCEMAVRPLPAARLLQTRELLAWCRTMALVNRARCQQRLNQLAISGRYTASPAAAPPQRLLARF